MTNILDDLSIDVETPTGFGDVDFERIAAEFGQTLHLITDIEGTAINSPWWPWDAKVDEVALESIGRAAELGVLEGAHSVTNRGFRGLVTTNIFTKAVQAQHPELASFRQTALTRDARKPSGIMSQAIHRQIVEWRRHQGAINPERFVALMFGDKYTDMLEASRLHQETGALVVGFWVEFLGGLDSPIDMVINRRKKYDRQREAAVAQAENRFVVSA